MKTKRIKASTILIEQSNPAPTDGRVFESRAECKWHYILPADADSYERMVEQGATGIMRCWKGAVMHETWRTEARAALRAIGITPRSGGKGRK